MKSRMSPKTNLPRMMVALGYAALSLSLAGCAGTPRVASDNAEQVAVHFDQSTLDLIQNATFEVIAKKPTKDSLSYEKPLPLNLLPYSVRTDKYEPLGTAFAIAPNRYVSAAHVLDLSDATQRTGFSLRDRTGRVYPIDKILKYSSRRDFVVFSVKNAPSPQAVFQPNIHPRVNENVYSVGNALGQGIVIRGGLYTSNTPEDRNGAWSWIRFSAAASPGNSGGPLLDQDGKLIGVVEAKSESENLNYALPIAEVLNAKNDLAVYDSKQGYGIDNMPMTKIGTMKREFALPKSIAALNHELVQVADQQNDMLMDAMFRENREKIFPNGPGSTELLHNINSTLFPGIIGQGSDGVWDYYTPKKTNDAELGVDGRLTFGDLGNSTYFHMQIPSNVSLTELVGHPKRLMDLFLKGIGYTRNISVEKIAITSFGNAQYRSTFTDNYARKWLVMYWPIEFSDQQAAMMVLPVPDGFVGMIRIVSTGDFADHVRDMKALTNFVYVSYYGTLRQWRQFLSIKGLLPAVFAGIHVHFDYGRDFSYESKRIAFSYPSTLMKITPNSDLQLGFSYFRDHGKVVWDVSTVVAGEDKNTNTSFAVYRYEKPSPNMDDKYRSAWNDLVHRRYPFNRSSYFADNVTIIGTSLTQGDKPQTAASGSIIYSAMYNADGPMQQRAAEGKLDEFLRAVRVHETGLKTAARGVTAKTVASR